MKTQKKETRNGLVVAVTMSYSDLLENDLATCFSMSKLQFPTLLRTGKFFNFVNNYVLTEFYDKDGTYVIAGAQNPTYKIHGEADKFIEIQTFFPKMAADFHDTKYPENFDGMYSKEEAKAKAPEGYEPDLEKRIEKYK